LNRLLIFLILVTVFSSYNILAYAENYNLEIDENLFEINYSIEGNVIAMAIDKELTSLLVGLENVQNDSLFYIQIPHDLLRAEKNEFIVLVNGFETDYSISTTDLDSKLTIPIPSYTEEIEIIGTYVIPEFPFGSLMILVSMITMTIIISKFRYKIFR
jgi:predicted secreted protein with PEFG-CTERM motif